jgi:hypothetical protein
MGQPEDKKQAGLQGPADCENQVSDFIQGK